MDEFGVLDRLIFNQEGQGNAESIAILLGMVHLYRASGVHLLAFFSFLSFVVQGLSKLLGATAELSRFLSLVLCGMTIFWIWHFQDFRVTLVRPIFTFLIRIFFEQRGAKARIALPLLLTFVSEWLISRDTSLSSGALHYYLSVAGGLFAYHARPKANAGLRHLFLAVGSWLPLAVISLFRDHLVAYATPLYSLFSLPVISVFLYPITLVDLFFHHRISPWTVKLWTGFLKLLFGISTLGITFSSVMPIAVWISLPIAVGLSLFWKRIRLKKLSFAWVLMSLVLGRRVLADRPGPAQVIQLDVHQGDAAAILIPQVRTEMVDVGSLKTYAPNVWLAKLASHGMNHVDGILLSHLDEDHVGALKELLLLVPVSCIETNRLHWNSEKGLKLQSWISAHAPEVILASHGCVRLPEVAWFQSKRSSGNELMGGIAFTPNDHEVYLALGDGDAEQELKYEKRFQAVLATHPVRIWKIGHHGSRFSSDLGFLERLHAGEFWISVGKHNPYHHPSIFTLQKLSGLPGKVYRTDEDGDIVRSFKE